jgi:S-formylglutathione hydrolase FrmB
MDIKYKKLEAKKIVISFTITFPRFRMVLLNTINYIYSVTLTRLNQMKRIMMFLIAFVALAQVEAAVVDTIQVFSNSMQKNVPVVVVKPENYNSMNEIPVVYLLHGHSGNYSNWVTKGAGTEKFADRLGLLLVCPDGGYNSWYWDSPVRPESKYETFVSDELVKYIDSKYKTIKNRSGRGITGLSMGGHGALYLAFRHQDVFGVAGSMSGGVDIRPFPESWDMAKQLGPYADYPERWEKNTVINMLNLLRPQSLALIIDCGTEDFFYKVNENLHQELLSRNIPHDYITRPGAHNWAYWKNSVKFQLLFMKNYFESSRKG